MISIDYFSCSLNLNDLLLNLHDFNEIDKLFQKSRELYEEKVNKVFN